MTFYTDLRDNDAAPLIAEFGMDGVLRQLAPTYDEATGISTNAATDTAIKFLKLKLGNRTEFQEELVARAAYILLVSAKELATAGVTPEATDKVVFGSQVYAILDINEVGPGGTAVVYKFLVED